VTKCDKVFQIISTGFPSDDLVINDWKRSIRTVHLRELQWIIPNIRQITEILIYWIRQAAISGTKLTRKLEKSITEMQYNAIPRSNAVSVRLTATFKRTGSISEKLRNRWKWWESDHRLYDHASWKKQIRNEGKLSLRDWRLLIPQR